MLFWLRMIGAVILGILFVWVFVMNWWIIVHCMRTKKHISWVPLLGGLFGVAALLIVPIDGARTFWWLPLIVDFGSAPGLGLTAIFLVRYWTTGKLPGKQNQDVKHE